MRVIPVIDLKDGLVVRGIAGERERYRPIVSTLATDARPGSIATAFVQRLGLREIYVADLDAIAGGEPDWAAYREIAATGATLMIDAGLRNATAARRMVEFAAEDNSVTGIIAALESCQTAADLREILGILGTNLGLFSLDLMHGVPTTAVAAWKDLSAEEIARTVLKMGFQRLIVLDLADVGVDRGVGTLGLCRALRTFESNLEVIAGGGVRHVADLYRLAQSGCDAALVASSLHDGRLGTAALQQM
jgi:phosphoribosylformimino-5-aminoimidazole carboxamide ribotide isomerase